MTKNKPTYQIIMRGVLQDGTDIQVEDWSPLYPEIEPESSTLAAYPVSRYTFPGGFSPKAGKTFRATFRFPNKEVCLRAFADLCAGKKNLADFVEYLQRREYAKAITGG